MRDWPAYLDLKKKIDDFNDSCPLLELMANKAMKDRHWKRIEKVTKMTFDVESPTFTLRSVMEAPLLENKDDIEVSSNNFFLQILDSRNFLLCLGHLHKCSKRKGH